MFGSSSDFIQYQTSSNLTFSKCLHNKSYFCVCGYLHMIWLRFIRIWILFKWHRFCINRDGWRIGEIWKRHETANIDAGTARKTIKMGIRICGCKNRNIHALDLVYMGKRTISNLLEVAWCLIFFIVDVCLCLSDVMCDVDC